MAFSPNTDTSLGVDIDAVNDLPLRFNLVTGNKNLGNAIARRLTTTRGALSNISPSYGPNYGFDIRQFLLSGQTPSTLTQMQVAISSEVEKDERVLSVSTTVIFNQQLQSAKVTIYVTTQSGPFQLILNVNQVTVDILAIQE